MRINESLGSKVSSRPLSFFREGGVFLFFPPLFFLKATENFDHGFRTVTDVVDFHIKKD